MDEEQEQPQDEQGEPTAPLDAADAPQEPEPQAEQEPAALPEAEVAPQGEAPAPEPVSEIAPEPSEAPSPEPTELVWQALIPQDVPDNAEAWAAEHEWQLEHNPSYSGQFAPK